MAFYKQKPVIIEAMEFTYPPTDELIEFCGGKLKNFRKERHIGAIGKADLVTQRFEGVEFVHMVNEGDMIIKDDVALYVCIRSEFDDSYVLYENH